MRYEVENHPIVIANTFEGIMAIIRRMINNNKEGKCAGCEIIFNKIRDEETKNYISYKWCEHCYQRRKQGIPIRQTL